ncbi:TM2 domain-containing protein [Paenibacillus sp. 1001270B_150601_E10]|uniref:TM2 domain-containing protein n=1 Tax=Paenibacillus sp. 1001270B_150601_E10 TaxID=2787079 RepID=UPI0018A06D8D|nr:TM2 domain-containing protein [Paenibacillus sp. 1001270B_150601_E10]
MLSRHDLSTKELLLLQSELRSHEKSAGVAYLLLIGGHLGAHRFYLKRTGTAIVQLILFLIAVVMYAALVIFVETDLDVLTGLSVIGLILSSLALTIWIIVDLFLISKMVREYNAKVEQDLLMQIKGFPQNMPTF